MMEPESKREGAQLTLVDSFIGPPKPKKKRTSGSIGPKVWNVAQSEVIDMMTEGDWEKAGPLHFVALYAVLHKRIYGIEPAELNVSKERQYAMYAAGRMYSNEFNTDASAMVQFMKWCWVKEQSSLKWRRANPERDNGFRIGWKYQFNGKLLSDWRMQMVAARGTG